MSARACEEVVLYATFHVISRPEHDGGSTKPTRNTYVLLPAFNSVSHFVSQLLLCNFTASPVSSTPCPPTWHADTKQASVTVVRQLLQLAGLVLAFSIALHFTIWQALLGDKTKSNIVVPVIVMTI